MKKECEHNLLIWKRGSSRWRCAVCDKKILNKNNK